MKNERTEMSEPAAYDAEGRPLYYQSPQKQPSLERSSLVLSKPEAHEGHNFDPRLRAQYANEPKLVHANRDIEPQVPQISPELQRKCEASAKMYPFLNLSEGEFVVLRIKRHPIGLLMPIFFTSLTVATLVALMILVPDMFAGSRNSLMSGSILTEGLVLGILFILTIISVAIGAVSVWVYQRNQFFLTNESVIQEIQHSLFSHHEQTVSLGSIEDASFKRRGVLQYLFNYGTMRLSTEGEETTYRFDYVENPKQQVAIVNNAVEAFKNGRPVGDD